MEIKRVNYYDVNYLNEEEINENSLKNKELNRVILSGGAPSYIEPFSKFKLYRDEIIISVSILIVSVIFILTTIFSKKMKRIKVKKFYLFVCFIGVVASLIYLLYLYSL